MSDSSFASSQKSAIDLSNINPDLTSGQTGVFRATAKQSLIDLAGSLAITSHGIVIAPESISVGEEAVGPTASGIELPVLEQIIKSNRLNVSPSDLKVWLDSKPEDFATNAEINDTDRQVLTRLAENEGLVNKTFLTGNVVNSGIFNHSLKICRIHVRSPAGIYSTGTGVFLTESQVLTCWHVLGPPMAGMIVEVEVPHFHGPHILNNAIDVWSGIRYRAKEIQDKPHLLAKSQTLPNDLEKEDWPVASAPTNALDYCVFEIDRTSEKWTLSQTAPGNLIWASNTGFVSTIVSNQFPKMRPPSVHYRAEELSEGSVTVHTLSSDLKLETRHAGSVKATSPEFQRIRYGEGNNGLKNGSSGSPVTNADGEFIAIHNAATGSMSQAIPIGPILEDINRQEPDLLGALFS